jgi:hypothetical protein
MSEIISKKHNVAPVVEDGWKGFAFEQPNDRVQVVADSSPNIADEIKN